MKPVNKILVALDFSEHSQATLETAAYWAKAVGAVLTVVSIVNQRDVYAIKAAGRYVEMPSEEEFVKRLVDERNAKIDDCLEHETCRGLTLERIITVGVPGREILSAITKSGCDMVVIGTRGRSELSEAVFGSTAEKVVRRSPVQVLAVPPQG